MTALPLTYAQALWRRSERTPDAELLRIAGEGPWTVAETRTRAASWALHLARTVGQGDVVVTCVDSGPYAVALTAAVSALGAVELPLDPEIAPDWARRLVDVTGAQVVVSSTARVQSSLVRDLARGRRLELVDGATELHSAHSDADSVTPVDLSEESPALIVSTSGTTGRPKAAMLPVGAPIRQARRVSEAMQYGHHDVLLSLFPWHHINARNAATLPAIISGARVVFAPRFSASGFWDLVRQEKVTAFNFMGAVCMMLLRRPATARDREHTLTKAYGGPAPAELVSSFAERFGVTLRQAYACTELGDISTTHLSELRPGAAGRPLGDREVRIVDDRERDVPEGTAGEILVRPTRPGTALSEYVADIAATTDAWRDGWFATHDRGYLLDGWLYVTGRCSDVIRRRGVNLDPERIERVILEHPDVAETAAVAVPSELTENEVLAVVVPGPGRTPPPDDLWHHCARSLPRAFVPRYLSFTRDLPHTSNHKLDRAAIRRRGIPPDVWDADTRPTPLEPR